MSYYNCSEKVKSINSKCKEDNDNGGDTWLSFSKCQVVRNFLIHAYKINTCIQKGSISL